MDCWSTCYKNSAMAQKQEVKMILDTLCRASYCNDCFKRGDPHKGNLVALFGSSHQSMHVKKVTGGIRGFTPHIFELLQKQGDYFIVRKTCGICGYEKRLEKDIYKLTPIKQSIVKIHLKDYNGLLKFTDPQYRVA